MKKIEISNYTRLTATDKLTPEEIKETVKQYFNSTEFTRLNNYDKYYSGDNSRINDKVSDRNRRSIKPNEKVPTGYYSTVVDSMSGYMFSNVAYQPLDKNNVEYSDTLTAILNANDADVKDMTSGVNALAYNKGVELVYTVGDENNLEVKYTPLDPRQIIPIYTDSIEPELFCALFIRMDKDNNFMVDAIYSDEWQYYLIKDDKITEREESRILYFSECPVIIYKAELLTDKSPFDIVIPYIDALDYLITGNANDIQKLADAILKLSATVPDKYKDNMDELRFIENLNKEDIAEFITKDMNPQFREYLTKLLISEIHKHSHVIDWYSSDNMTGELSAKAMRTRLFDMDMYSNRIEQVYIKGIYKRIKLINEILTKIGVKVSDVEVILNRTKPSEFIDLAPVLNTLEILDTKTKLQMLGFDDDKIAQIISAKDEEKQANVEMFMQESRTQDDNQDNNDQQAV